MKHAEAVVGIGMALILIMRSPAAAGAAADWKRELKARLESEYGPFVKMNKTGPSGAGAVYRIALRGILSGPAEYTTNFVLTKVSRDGQVSGAAGLGGVFQSSSLGNRPLQVGEEVYIVQILVADDHVDFRTVTTAPRDVNVLGTTVPVHYTSHIRLLFEKRSLESASAEDVKKLVDKVLIRAPQ